MELDRLEILFCGPFDILNGDIIVDEDTRCGGRLNAECEEIDVQPGHAWAASVADRLAGAENVRVMTRSTVVGPMTRGLTACWNGMRSYLPRKGRGQATLWHVVTKRSVLAAGAIKRPVAFQNNDRPGVTTASAVRSYVNRRRVSPGQWVTVLPTLTRVTGRLWICKPQVYI